MTGCLVFLIIFIMMVSVWAWGEYITPRRMTRAPVNKIIELVKRRDGFFVDNNVDEKEKKYKHVDFAVDFVLFDTVNSTSSVFIRDQFSGAVKVRGDFEWMNNFERKRLYKVVREVYNLRIKKYKEACTIESDARNKLERQAAIKVYESR